MESFLAEYPRHLRRHFARDAPGRFLVPTTRGCVRRVELTRFCKAARILAAKRVVRATSDSGSLLHRQSLSVRRPFMSRSPEWRDRLLGLHRERRGLQRMQAASFTTFDLFGRWSPNKNWEVNASIQNLFDKKAPFDPYLPNRYVINYNQAWHQAGAVVASSP
jgi:TonB dependent receptor